MAIKRYNSKKDNTIVSALKENLSSRGTKGNMGASDILEVFSIFGQASSSSLEQARILVEFPVSTISENRDSGIVPASGSVSFKFKMSNTPHGQTTPKNYTIVTHPIAQAWTEGDGLDMESYLDIEASNWLSASEGLLWHNTGSDYVSASYVNTTLAPLEYSQIFETGIENIELDITGITEEWIKFHKGTAKAATGSLNFLQNPSENQTVTIYSHEGEKYVYTFITSSTYSVNNSVYLELSGNAAQTAGSLQNRIRSDFAGKIATNLNTALLSLTQSIKGIQGNTIISSTAPNNTIAKLGFGGGTGMPNYGLVVKLQDVFEGGSKKKSYYTKKFYSRSSHEFFLKPQIEAQWDDSIKDDRNYILKSSSVAPAADNLNNIYYYNRVRGNLSNIPNTGSSLVVRFYSTLGQSPEYVTSPAGASVNHITASKNSNGIYKASFAYSGSLSSLQEVWHRSVYGVEKALVTGSKFTIYNDEVDSSYEIPNYLAKITNLKESYLQSEKATLRVYTRNKNWQPNIYTVASSIAPVNTIREMFYKITKISDNYDVILYSTGSTPSYSKLSYDKDGSYFDLDMKLLEKNNAYQISFVFKDGPNYLELPEKFKFRVDP